LQVLEVRSVLLTLVDDPFDNDPFFKGSGGGIFGRMEEMMKGMRDNMGMMSGGGNHF
jgi:hypothetical protein